MRQMLGEQTAGGVEPWTNRSERCFSWQIERGRMEARGEDAPLEDASDGEFDLESKSVIIRNPENSRKNEKLQFDSLYYE